MWRPAPTRPRPRRCWDSLHYPVRGAVAWKSIVGTNVAADALSNLASPGLLGGVLIVSGEDYGEGASVIQERTQALAMKCTLLLLDPRLDLCVMVQMVEHAFAMSEDSHMPAVLQVRIRACHVHDSFTCRDNIAPAICSRQPPTAGRALGLRLRQSRSTTTSSPAWPNLPRCCHPAGQTDCSAGTAAAWPPAASPGRCRWP